MAKKKVDVFSAVKAVKANARERLGTPPPSTPIPDRKDKAEHGRAKHKLSLEEVLERAERDGET